MNSGLAAITSDSFAYTVTSNTGGSSAVTSAPATVSLTLAERVWYVRNNAVAEAMVNRSRRSTRFQVGSAHRRQVISSTFIKGTGRNDDRAGHRVHIESGSEPHWARCGAGVVNSNTLLGAGSFPVIGNTVTLANNVTFNGLDINAGANTGISGTSVTGVNVTPRDVTTTTGTAVSIGGSGNTGPYSFRSISKNGGTTKAISLTNTAGTFTVTGIGATAGSGGTIANIVGADAVSLNNTSGLVSLSNMIIQDITASGDSSAANDTHSGVDAIHGQMVNAGLTLNRVTIQRISDDGINGSVDAVPVTSPPTATVFNGLTITNCTIQDTSRYKLSGHGPSRHLLGFL